VADDVPDDEGHPCAGQRNDVEPVAADTAQSSEPGQGGTVAVRDVEGALLRQYTGQQAALERDRHRVLA
jgi:hypothetical protein